MFDLLLVSTTHRSMWLGPAVVDAMIRQFSPGKICPGKVQSCCKSGCTTPRASMTATDLTVTGFVPMLVTLHSAWSGVKTIPVDMMVACAVDARIMLARAVHTLRDIGLLLLVMGSCRQEPPPEDAGSSASGPTADHFLSSEMAPRRTPPQAGLPADSLSAPAEKTPANARVFGAGHGA